MRHIVQIAIRYTYESCQRHSYYVELTTDEGFEMTPSCWQTGSVYTEFKGLSRDEALQRALSDAHEWGDFLQIPVDPFKEDGEVKQLRFAMETYTTRRVLGERRAAKAAEQGEPTEGNSWDGGYSGERLPN